MTEMSKEPSNEMKEKAELKQRKINHMQSLIDEAYESGIATESFDDIIQQAEEICSKTRSFD